MHSVSQVVLKKKLQLAYPQWGASSKPNFNIPILAFSLHADRGGGTEGPTLSQPPTIPQSSWCWQSTELWDTQHESMKEG